MSSDHECKAVIMLRRSPEQSHEDFALWWTVTHAPLARQLPGLRRAVFNLVSADPNDDSSSGADAAAVDGIAELWFDSREAFDDAYASDVGREVVEDTLRHVGQRVRHFVGEHVIYGEGAHD